jgi:hypothetical protein
MRSPLSIFYGRCGHRWVGATNGSDECPVCGADDGTYNGDHHLYETEEIAVQPEDWGCGAWTDLERESERLWREYAESIGQDPLPFG